MASEPEVTGDTLDEQIAEMFGGPEKVGGQEPPEAGVAQPAPPETERPSTRETSQRTEPEVKAPPAEEGDRLAAALRSIEQLQQEVTQLRAAPRAAPEAARPEPAIVFDEVLGRRIPKDRSTRPIKVTADDLLKLGWNEDPAKVIEDLGNAFLGYVLDVIPTITTQGWQQQVESQRAVQENFQVFWSEHDDLKDMAPFVATVEAMSRQDGSLIPERDFTVRQYGTIQAAQKAYGQALGRKTREKVAAMRGLSIDQYLATIGKTSSTTTRPASRAVTTSGSASQVRSAGAARGSQQAEMDDLIDNR